MVLQTDTLFCLNRFFYFLIARPLTGLVVSDPDVDVRGSGFYSHPGQVNVCLVQ